MSHPPSKRAQWRAMLRDPRYRRLLFWTVPVVLFCGGLSMAAQSYATFLGSTQPPSRDLLLDVLPVWPMYDLVVWGPVTLSAFLAYVLWRNPHFLPFTLKTIGLVFAVRAFFMILTPLGRRPEAVDPGYDGLLRTLVYDPRTNDFFFSGHTAYPFISGLIFWDKPFVRWTFLTFSVVLGTSVLLAHAHYSIDVFAVPFMAGGVLWWAKKVFAADYSYIESLTPVNPVHPSPDA